MLTALSATVGYMWFVVICPRVHLSQGQLNDHLKYYKISPAADQTLILTQLEPQTSEPSDNWADTGYVA